MIVENPNTKILIVSLFKNGYPILIGWGYNGKVSMKMSRSDFELKGDVIFKARGYGKRGMERKLNGRFEIV